MALEFLQIAEAVAREKGIDRDSILQAMEQSMQTAARRKFGMHLNIQGTIDRITGDLTLFKVKEVVNQVMEPVSKDEYRLAQREHREVQMRPAFDGGGYPIKENDIQIHVDEAVKLNPEYKVGDIITEELPPMDFGRIAAQAAKQVIFQKVREAEREKEYDEYKDYAGRVINGIVKRADHYGVTVDLGRAEAYMPRDEMIPRETYRQGDRVRAYVFKVERQQRGPQVFLSRTHPEFLKVLFTEEVPEIENGIIEVMGVARDAGFRAKIAVKSYDNNLDPVGACVGIRGARVQNITDELQGERIDIIEWTAEPAEYLIKALSPAEVTKVVVDEDEQRIEVIVPEDKLSVAIGRRGQNVRLASILTGWDIDIMTEAESDERRAKEYEIKSKAFIEALDVDESICDLLITEGFSSVNELLLVDTSELAAIDGFNEEVATELQRRAKDALEAIDKELASLNVEEDIFEIAGVTKELAVVLARADVKSRDDLAELATDELTDIVGENTLRPGQAESMIMEARKAWFEDEDEDELDSSVAATTAPDAAASSATAS